MTINQRITVYHEESKHEGEFILYWMTSARRSKRNFALQEAIREGNESQKPVVVVEALSLEHRWANDRSHTFVLQGMLDNREAFQSSNVTYIPYVETQRGEGKGLLSSFVKRAHLLFIDDYPTYLPKIITQKSIELATCQVRVVDSNGIIPMRLSERPFKTAYAFRRYMQKQIVEQLLNPPKEYPLHEAAKLPILGSEVINEIFNSSNTPQTPFEFIWRVAESGPVGRDALKVLAIDHSVEPIFSKRGGSRTAKKILHEFIQLLLPSYFEDRNKPNMHGTSGLSPWLHFGHVSSFEAVLQVLDKENWDPSMIQLPHNGRREGWWNLSKSAEGFLDQIITWRELGFIFAHNVPEHDQWESIPEWAQNSLMSHIDDPRVPGYTFADIEQAKTDDELWNAAQNQLLREGIIQNYMRMLWGKKILQWAPDPQTAARWMIHLNDKWALDGRDPNSYTGVFWVLGRHDRAWGPEREIFGKVRYMTSDSTKRKYRTQPYIEKFS